jgi:hypothetical protein
MKDTTIKFINRPSYGRDRFYPVSEFSKFLCLVSETETLTERVLTIAKNQGFEIIEEHQKAKF